jgi:DNA ligase-associated metallophosphoesterase
MQRPLAIELAGEDLLLDPAPGLIWPAERTGFIADTHFGKGAVMRRGGVAVPSGSSRDDLARLSALIERHALTRLVVLGDFFHAPPMAGEPFVDAFMAWRRAHDQLALTVIRGNHDRPAGDALASVIDWQPEGSRQGPFELRHEPVTFDLHVLAGHQHPVTTLRGNDGDRARVGVFRCLPGLTILPAFGGLTGGHESVTAPDEHRVVVTPAGLFELPRPG